MASYKKPSDAFTPTRQTLQRGGAKITLHALDKRLKGCEMVVASSNNKAVENVGLSQQMHQVYDCLSALRV